ncbi:hypothetical protein [Psychrobacillus phage Perkons]|nr:hypothetical protein [Psychrobacillus phage Perkons]
MKTLNELTTKADELYRNLSDENAYNDTSDFTSDVEGFLDHLINYLESIGGQVEGMTYVNKNKISQ